MWQYCVIYLYPEELERELALWGDEGWELVTVIHNDTYNCFFKRKKVSQAKNEHPGFIM